MIMCIGEKMKTQRKTLTISKETTGTGLNRGDKLNERWINISAEKFVESSAHEIADEFTRVWNGAFRFVGAWPPVIHVWIG